MKRNKKFAKAVGISDPLTEMEADLALSERAALDYITLLKFTEVRVGMDIVTGYRPLREVLIKLEYARASAFDPTTLKLTKKGADWLTLRLL